MRCGPACVAIFVGIAALSAPAAAAEVNLGATLVNSCVLTLNSSGVMTPTSSGTRIGSDESGGGAATLGVIAIGAFPTISFGAPAMTTYPAGWTGTPTTEVSYTSSGGANQAFTSGSSSASLSALTDSFTIHGRVTSSTGFAAGSYNLRTVATCSQ